MILRFPLNYLVVLLWFVALCVPQSSRAEEASVPSEKQLSEWLGGPEVLAAMRSSCRIEAVAVFHKMAGNRGLGFKEKGQRFDLSPEQAAAVHQLLGDRQTYLDALSACIFEPGVKFVLHPKGKPVQEWLICLHCGELAVVRKGEKPGEACFAHGYGKMRELVKMIFAQNEDVQKALKELEEEDRRSKIQAQKDAEALVRWREMTPAPLKDAKMKKLLEANSLNIDVEAFRKPLADGIPDMHERIRALLTWFGSGSGPWSGYPIYESVAEELLLDYSTADLIAAIQGEKLTEAQMEGTARLFGGWTFSQKRPDDLKMLPQEWKKALLEHTLKSEYEYNRHNAKSSFR